MKNKINIRLMGIAILAIIATVIGTTIIYYNLFQNQVRADLEVSANLLKDIHYSSEDSNRETTEGNTTDLERFTDIAELRVTIIDRDGDVLYDNYVSANKLSNHQDRPEIKAALGHGVGESVRTSDTLNKNTYYYATMLDNDTVLRVATEAKSLWSVFLSVAPIIMLTILLVIALCVIVSHLITKQFLKPIEQMAENLENADYESPYKEFEPFYAKLKAQHTDILSAAKARQDFTANVSHELKTPLTAISGYAELLESGMVDEEKSKHFCHEIRKSSERLLVLINDIIDLAGLDRAGRQLTFDEMDLYSIVSECMESLAVNAGQRSIKLSMDGESCIVHGNKETLKELTENLVQNAIRYNNPGGKVEVSVKNVSGRPTLVVKDNGIGIPASEQDRIFERFYCVDKSRSKASGGTGLGLAIVKHIVEIHDAKISLDSAPGIGTTITVTF